MGPQWKRNYGKSVDWTEYVIEDVSKFFEI